MIRVWDPLVRVFHWSLVAAFALAWLTGEDSLGLHEWAGYGAAALIALRVVWGFFGTRYARFTQFVRGPGTLRAYLGDMLHNREARYLGHNPAGAVMVLAILVTMSGTAYTGWLMEDAARLATGPALSQIVAPAHADDDGDAGEGRGGTGGGESVLKDIHAALANLMLVLVVLHVGGVALASVRHRENLIRAMITGDKRPPASEDIA